MAVIKHNALLICHECDALQNVSKVGFSGVVNCSCCGSQLFKKSAGGIEKSLALTISAMILYIVANVYPILTLTIAGTVRSTTLTGSATVFLDLGRPDLAAVVWLPTVFVPGFILFCLLYVLFSVRYELGLPYTKPMLAWVSRLLPWGMMDVFFLGVLVALVKLIALADIIIGTGFYALVALIMVYAAAVSSLDLHEMWESLDDDGTENAAREITS